MIFLFIISLLSLSRDIHVYGLTPCAINTVCMAIQDLGYRTSDEVNRMSNDDCRNTMIVELDQITTESISQLQGYNTEQLIGKMYVAPTLLKIDIDIGRIKSMTTNNQRNTLIVETEKCAPMSIGQLQGYSDKQLSCLVVQELGVTHNIKDSAWEVLNVDFDLDSGSIVSQTPLIIGNKICDNLDGGSETHSMTLEVSKEVTNSNSFQRTHGFGITIGTEFKTGIPFVASGKISTEISTTHDFTYGEETIETQTIGGSFEVNCAPGEIIQAEASVWTAKLDVPYTIE
eukprot:929088_1